MDIPFPVTNTNTLKVRLTASIFLLHQVLLWRHLLMGDEKDKQNLSSTAQHVIFGLGMLQEHLHGKQRLYVHGEVELLGREHEVDTTSGGREERNEGRRKKEKERRGGVE